MYMYIYISGSGWLELTGVVTRDLEESSEHVLGGMIGHPGDGRRTLLQVRQI
jgi:hypothetical protein